MIVDGRMTAESEREGREPIWGVSRRVGGDGRELLRMFREGVVMSRRREVSRKVLGPNLPDVTLGTEYNEDGDANCILKTENVSRLGM